MAQIPRPPNEAPREPPPGTKPPPVPPPMPPIREPPPAPQAARQPVRAIKASGATSLGAIAKALRDRGIRTPAGNTTWHRAQVA